MEYIMQEFKVVHDNSDSFVVRRNGLLARLMKSAKLVNITNGSVFYAEFTVIHPATTDQLEIIEILSGYTLDLLPIVQ